MSNLPQHLTLSPGQAYFDVDGDKDLHASYTDDSDTPPTWRGDPVETGSDSSIVVVTNELQAVTYYVHKSVMCFGSRQSKYFASAMLQNRSSSTEPKKILSIKVELDQRDAENFPIFLDFMYASRTPREVEQHRSPRHPRTIVDDSSHTTSSVAAPMRHCSI